MSESKRTLLYGIVAAASVGLAWTADRVTRPKVLEQFGDVGSEFYAEFEDPTLAKSLRVVAFDDETATVREFSIEQRNSGDWVIPSHFDYPADAEDRLTDTATSILHVKRDLLASRYPADHEQYNVLDPLDDDPTKISGRGERLTLTAADDTVLCDYIIGKEADDREGYYYVRIPKDDKTYICKLEVDLSTKFADWIEPDLLKLDSFNLSEIVIDRYSIDEERGRIVTDSVSTLRKEDSNWTLEDLKDDEEMQTSEITTMVTSLDDLKIVGVRPKPEGLNADLSVDANMARNPIFIQALRSSLASKGFFIAEQADGEPRLVSNEGQLIASTNEGVVYNLYFGEVFTGSDEEIETGFTKSDDEKAEQSQDTKESSELTADAADKDSADADDDATSSDDAQEDSDDAGTKRSRYLFVSTKFDEKYLENKPVEPVESPEFDDESDDASEETSDDDDDTESKGDDDAEGDADAGDAGDDDSAEPDADTADGGEDKKEEAAKARDEYEVAKRQYERDLEDWNKRVEEGKKESDDLNARFAAWYYVISAESFDKLRLAREDLVKPKEEEADEDDATTDGDAADSASDTSTNDAPASGAGAADDSSESSAAPQSEPESAVSSEVSNDAPATDGAAATPDNADESATDATETTADDPKDAPPPGQPEPSSDD